MAASAIDEAIRNCVAVGADPNRIAILDNFCWGLHRSTGNLGSLVRAALACYDMATVLKTPFISGKDSLNNEFSFTDSTGTRQTIAIPPTLLISAMGQVEDVSQCVTMDLKSPGNVLYQIGETKNELGGSHFSLVNGLSGGEVPKVDAHRAKKVFEAVQQGIRAGLVRACHDLSEGGLAVALAEMAFAGGLGAKVSLDELVCNDLGQSDRDAVLLFSESNTRFVCEVQPDHAAEFEAIFNGLSCRKLGYVVDSKQLLIERAGQTVISAEIDQLKESWQRPLRR